MYDIYMRRFISNTTGNEVVTERLIYSIPILTDEHKSKAFTDPIVKCEMGKTGTLEFSVPPTNPLYNCWIQMRTIIRVEYDGTTIFRGRVLTIDNTLWGDKKIHCEGDLAFLMDSQQPGTKEEKRSSITILAYLTQIINNHNSQMNESFVSANKVMTLGEVPGQYSNSIKASQKVNPDSSKKYGSDSWETTMSALENLQKQYGGYFRTRYVSGVCYLDWLDNWYNNTANSQPIQISQNLIELQSSAEVDNIFTALIPLGSSKGNEITIQGYKNSVHGNNKRILVPQIVDQFADSELNSGYHSKSDYQNAVNDYGIIYKTEKFDNADTQEKLWNYALDYIKNNYAGGLTGFSLTAFDMHHVDNTVQKYLVGDKVRVVYPDLHSYDNGTVSNITKQMSVTSISYNLNNPEKNTYSLGIPNSILNKKYGTPSNTKGGGGSGGGAQTQKVEDDLLKALDNDESEYGLLAWTYVINEKYNNAEYQKLLQEDPDLRYAPAVLKSSKNLIKSSLDPDPNRLDELYTSIILDGKTGTTTYMQNPMLTEMDNAVRSIVINGYESKMTFLERMERDPYMRDPKKLAELYSPGGSRFKLNIYKETPVSTSTSSVLAAMIDGSDGTIASIVSKLGLDGSGDKATIIQDGLTSMLKFFNPSTATQTTPTETAEIDGAAGKGKIGKDSNNNWQIKLNETITYVDQNGTTRTTPGFVCAKDFNLPEIASFKTKLAVVDELVAGKATIGELNAVSARVGTLEATTLRTDNLYAAIANLSNVNIQSLTFASASSSRGGITANSVATTNFSQGGVSCYFPSGVKSVTLSGPTNNQYTLSTETYGGSTNDYTFSRAISSANWEWSGGSARVTLSPQNQSFNSPAVDNYELRGDPSYSSATGKVSQNIDILDSSSDRITGFRVSIDASDARQAGYDAGKPNGTVTIGSKITGTTYNVSISRSDGTALGSTMNFYDIYEAAREGYTLGTFTRQTITLQGTPTSSLTLQGAEHKVTPISGSGVRLSASQTYYGRSSSQFTVQGSEHKVTPISGSGTRLSAAQTFYERSSSTFTVQGSRWGYLTEYGYATLYNANGDSQGYHHWYYSGSGTEVFNAGTTTKYEAVSNGSCRRVISTGGSVFYNAGSELTLYDAGTTTKYEAVANGTCRREISTGGSVFYNAGSELTLYDAGNDVGILYNAGEISNDYYTKS